MATRRHRRRWFAAWSEPDDAARRRAVSARLAGRPHARSLQLRRGHRRPDAAPRRRAPLHARPAADARRRRAPLSGHGAGRLDGRPATTARSAAAARIFSRSVLTRSCSRSPASGTVSGVYCAAMRWRVRNRQRAGGRGARPRRLHLRLRAGASYLTDDPAACANCHVMQEHFDAWPRSSHRTSRSATTATRRTTSSAST